MPNTVPAAATGLPSARLLAFPTGQPAHPETIDAAAAATYERYKLADMVDALTAAVVQVMIAHWYAPMPAAYEPAYSNACDLLNRHQAGEPVTHAEAADVGYALIVSVLPEVAHG